MLEVNDACLAQDVSVCMPSIVVLVGASGGLDKRVTQSQIVLTGLEASTGKSTGCGVKPYCAF